MSSLPPEDQPDAIEIAGVEIPIQYEDDPRLEEERKLWHDATATAPAAQSADELLDVVRHPDWRVRLEVIPRLRARWSADPRTLPALIELVDRDPVSEVRDQGLLSLTEFPYDSLHRCRSRASLHRRIRRRQSDGGVRAQPNRAAGLERS